MTQGRELEKDKKTGKWLSKQTLCIGPKLVKCGGGNLEGHWVQNYRGVSRLFHWGGPRGAIGCVHDILECEVIISVGGQGPVGLLSVTW